jgi:hypothetical protein
MSYWTFFILLNVGIALFIRWGNSQSAKKYRNEEKAREQREHEQERIEELQEQISTLKDQSRKRDQDILLVKISADREKNKLPKHLGEYYKNPINININLRGININWKKINANIEYNMYDSNQYEEAIIKAISLSKTEALSSLKREIQRRKDMVIKEFPGNPKIQVINGRYGWYIKSNGKNYRIPHVERNIELDRDRCEQLIKRVNRTPKDDSGFTFEDFF